MVGLLHQKTVGCLLVAAMLSITDASKDECELYLAPSTIPNAGLGIFTTKALKTGDMVGNGDVAIPIVDWNWHRGNNNSSAFNIFEEYVWQGWCAGMGFESESQDLEAVQGFLPGMDGAINCNVALVNSGKSVGEYDTLLHRSRDPAAGAITPFHFGGTNILADVPAGGELFKYYGDSWFLYREEDFQDIPMLYQYEDAERFLNQFSSFPLSENAKRKLWSIVASMPWDSRYINAFPKSFQELFQAMDHGLRSLSQPSAVRSVEWLEKVGRCMDSIRPAESTIQGAGRGAFATRSFSDGSIITGSPLLHIPFSESHVNMYDYYMDEKGEAQRDTSYIVGQHLILNYCYGHKDSTLLLCPYGSGVNYINHNSTRANVKIQWTPDGITSQNDDWFGWFVDSMEHNYRIGLSFDYVATKDIMAGEELFLDYGSVWEEAWFDHVQHWEPGSPEYRPAKVWNEQFRHEPIRTQLEQELEPYPYNVRLRCHSKIGEPKGVWPDNWIAEDFGGDCKVLYRTTKADGDIVYEVELDETPTRQLRNVPREAIKFVDAPYTSDMFLPNPFRHSIMIPDDMFPQKWRNRL